MAIREVEYEPDGSVSTSSVIFYDDQLNQIAVEETVHHDDGTTTTTRTEGDGETDTDIDTDAGVGDGEADGPTEASEVSDAAAGPSDLDVADTTETAVVAENGVAAGAPKVNQ